VEVAASFLPSLLQRKFPRRKSSNPLALVLLKGGSSNGLLNLTVTVAPSGATLDGQITTAKLSSKA